MNRLRAVFLGDFDDAVAKQVAFARGRRSNVDGFVGFADVRRCGVGVAVDREALYAELAAGADDSYSNLASVGD